MDDLPEERRTLVLDLLASAGTPEAQGVMRRLLSLDVARRDGRSFAKFVQRLGFLERPDADTLAYLVGIYDETRDDAEEVHAACAYALGAAIGRAHLWGHVDVRDAAGVLRRDLLAATSVASKTRLLTALGHAGIESDGPILLRLADDREPRVRAAAILALRKINTREVKSWLLGALGGRDAALADAALSALFDQLLSEDELARLAELVVTDRTSRQLDRRVLRLLVIQKLNAIHHSPVVESATHVLLGRLDSSRALKPAPPRPRSSDESGEYTRYLVPETLRSIAPSRRSA
jgi:hypothetical protein